MIINKFFLAENVFKSVCSNEENTGLHGYITSDNFPNIPRDKSCAITVGDASGVIHLSIIQGTRNIYSLCDNILYIGPEKINTDCQRQNKTLDFSGKVTIKVVQGQVTQPFIIQYGGKCYIYTDQSWCSELY